MKAEALYRKLLSELQAREVAANRLRRSHSFVWLA